MGIQNDRYMTLRHRFERGDDIEPPYTTDDFITFDEYQLRNQERGRAKKQEVDS